VTVDPNATRANVAGSVSGSPSFEANVSVADGPTQNLPLQTAPTSTLQFGLGLQRENQINRTLDLRKKEEEKNQ
jgi:hypothetical protein